MMHRTTLLESESAPFLFEVLGMPNQKTVVTQLRNIRPIQAKPSWHIWDSETNQERGDFATHEDAFNFLKAEVLAGILRKGKT